MDFFLEPPLEPRFIFGNAWRVFADGEIDSNSATVLQDLVANTPIPWNSSIYLNSQGGSLLGGMALGRVIRAAGLLTYVGRRGDKAEGEYERYSTLPGECSSSATLAFLGGTYRWIDDSSEFGVHRFYDPAGDIGSDAAQVASSIIVEYLREMGVETALFSEMVRIGGGNVILLPRDRLEALNVVNTKAYATRWSVEAHEGRLYVKGERTSWQGINKFILYCENRRAVLLAIFNPEGRGDEAIEMGAHSLLLDGEPYPISDQRVGPAALQNGLVNVGYALTEELVLKLVAATSVGVALQFFHGAPLFLGFDGMALGEGREKIRGLLAHILAPPLEPTG